MPRFPSAQGRLNHEPGFHLSCDENLSEGWGPPLPHLATNERSRSPESVFTILESLFNMARIRVHV